MQIHPIYRANAEIKNYFNDGDSVFCFQAVDKLFDKQWCEQLMDTLAAPKKNVVVRRYFVTGAEIGNTKEPNIKYYLQIF